MRIKKKGAWADAETEGKPLNWELKQSDLNQSYFSGQGPHASTSAGTSGKVVTSLKQHLSFPPPPRHHQSGQWGAEQHRTPRRCIPIAAGEPPLCHAVEQVHAWHLLLQRKCLVFLDYIENLVLTILSLQDFIASSMPVQQPKIETQSREWEQLEEVFVENKAKR